MYGEEPGEANFHEFPGGAGENSQIIYQGYLYKQVSNSIIDYESRSAYIFSNFLTLG